MTAKELISLDKSGQSKLDLMRIKLADLLGTAAENVEIFTVRDVPGTGPDFGKSSQAEIHYSAHGSPYYRAARLDGIVWANKQSVSDFFNSLSQLVTHYGSLMTDYKHLYVVVRTFFASEWQLLVIAYR